MASSADKKDMQRAKSAVAKGKHRMTPAQKAYVKNNVNAAKTFSKYDRALDKLDKNEIKLYTKLNKAQKSKNKKAEIKTIQKLQGKAAEPTSRQLKAAMKASEKANTVAKSIKYPPANNNISTVAGLHNTIDNKLQKRKGTSHKAVKQGAANKLKAQGMKSMSAVTMRYNRKGKK
jgi:flagellar motor switch protein FliM